VPLNLPVAGRSRKTSLRQSSVPTDSCGVVARALLRQVWQCTGFQLGFNQSRLHLAHRMGREQYHTHRRGISAFQPCSCPPCRIAREAQAGALQGYSALTLLPFKGYLTHAETAHTDNLRRSCRDCSTNKENAVFRRVARTGVTTVR